MLQKNKRGDLPVRKFLPLLTLLLATTACGSPESGSRQAQRESQGPSTRYSEEATSDAAMAPPARSPRDISPPGIAPTSAPGVAFNYRYAFRMPANRIGQVQEEHAAACEKLGVERCRITGMLYRLVNDRDIEARLAFKLDPALARAFGKQGIEAVTRAAGMLVESEITGEDVGTQIASAIRSQADLETELAKVEQQLARTGLRAPERAELQIRVEQLRDSIRAIKAGKEAHREMLARTPVVFAYGSGDLAPGFDNGSPVLKALERAWDNVVQGFAVMLMIVISLLPWAVLVLLGWFGWRVASRGIRRKSPAAVSASAPGAE
jgi:hypothetical protein